MLSNLSDLSQLNTTAGFGSHDVALIWLTITSILMLGAPGLGVFFYLLMKSPQAQILPLKVHGTRTKSHSLKTRKAA